MKILKELLQALKDKGFATSEEKEEVKSKFEELEDTAKEEVKKEVEEVGKLPEEKPIEEEESEEEAEKKTAANIASMVSKLVAEQTKKASDEAEEKKSKVFYGEGAKNNEPEVKFYTKRNGENLTMPKSHAEHLGKWFQHFVKYARTKNPDVYQEMKSEYATLEKIASHQKLEPLQTGVAAEGGNLVPTLLFNELIPLLEDMSVIRPLARVLPIRGTNQLNLTGIASKPYTSWNAETAQKATTSVEFNQISLTPYILAGIITVTTQLIDDSPFNVVQIVSELLAEAIAKEEDRAFTMGSGSNQPTGFTTYTAGGVVNAGGALSFTHINDAWMKLPQKHRTSPKTVWVAHSDTIATLLNMQDGNNRPILNINDPFVAGAPTMHGKRVLEQNDMSSNEIWLIDLAWYWIGVAHELSIDTADQATIRSTNLWERNEIAIRAEEKLDGELVTARAAVEIQAVRT